MSNLKVYDTDDCLYLSFHVTDGNYFNESKKQIDTLMERLFLDQQTIVLSSAEQKEIIYKIMKPSIVSKRSTLANFFVNLQKAFNTLSIFSPHFTKFESGKK